MWMLKSVLLLLAVQSTIIDAFQATRMPCSLRTSRRRCPRHLGLNLQPPDIILVESVVESVVSSISDSLSEIPWSAKIGAAAASTGIPTLNWLYRIRQSQQNRPTGNTYPEAMAATYELSNVALMEFGDAAMVRPLLKQTQLEYRPLQLAYDANRDGYNALHFHKKVDGKGAAVILAKANGKWFGGYNPRGWASLGGSRPSRASFLFYQTNYPWFGGAGWQKLRVMGGGGMSCGNDLYDSGIYMGAEALVMPLYGANPRVVRSRLGTYFEVGPENRSTVLPKVGVDTQLQELKVLVGVYQDKEDIPNSGGVLDLGLY